VAEQRAARLGVEQKQQQRGGGGADEARNPAEHEAREPGERREAGEQQRRLPPVARRLAGEFCLVQHQNPGRPHRTPPAPAP